MHVAAKFILSSSLQVCDAWRGLRGRGSRDVQARGYLETVLGYVLMGQTSKDM